MFWIRGLTITAKAEWSDLARRFQGYPWCSGRRSRSVSTTNQSSERRTATTSPPRNMHSRSRCSFRRKSGWALCFRFRKVRPEGDMVSDFGSLLWGPSLKMMSGSG